MACISKLASAIAYDCDTGATGLINALIINKSDIASITMDANSAVQSIVLSPGAVAYKIDTIKRSLVGSSALKVNDGAPNAYTHTVTIVDTGDTTSASTKVRLGAYSNGGFVVIANPGTGKSKFVYGLYYGMYATSVDYSTHDNGRWVTVVASTPENVIGEDALFMGEAVYSALYAAAV